MKTAEEALEETIRNKSGYSFQKITWEEADKRKGEQRLKDKRMLEMAAQNGNLPEVQQTIQLKNSMVSTVKILDWRPISERT